MLNNEERIAYQQTMILKAMREAADHKAEVERLRGYLARVKAEGLNSLAVARDYIEANRTDGINCPCCDQFAKEYKRKLGAEVVRFVIWLDRYCAEGKSLHVNDWSDVSSNRRGGGDYAKSAHWGLARLMPNADTGKRTSGLWQPTQLGRDFARGLRSIPKYVHLYNNQATRFSGPLVYASQSVGEGFDYAELMRRGDEC